MKFWILFMLDGRHAPRSGDGRRAAIGERREDRKVGVTRTSHGIAVPQARRGTEEAKNSGRDGCIYDNADMARGWVRTFGVGGGGRGDGGRGVKGEE